MSSLLFNQATENLSSYWGYTSFREGQEEAIRSVLEERDTLVLFPTGGGKSLCYQLPATVLEGLTVVISPLVSLMQDQVQQLNDRGVPATFINSTLSNREKEQRLVNARNGMYDLLYCSPERLQTPLWEAELPNLNIDLIAIDEAHCISEWGHDFRPEYREIRSSMEPVADRLTWIALTATATPEVREDIRESLELDQPAVISRGFARPNLKWWVIQTPKKEQKLLSAVQKAAAGGSGIIYAGTRRNCEDLSRKISDRLAITAKAYHAGMDALARKKVQEDWISGELPLVVATNAFGMGIDKSDCRYVIHYQMPYSLESYYQEAGRAGRDGKESYPLLLVNQSDSKVADRRIKDAYPQRKQLQQVYDALCDHLNLAVGSEMEKACEVSYKALEKRSSLPERIVRAALKVLGQLGELQLIEGATPRIGVHFIANPDYIRERIQHMANRPKAEFIDTLFRQFGGEAYEDMKYLDYDYVHRKLDVAAGAVKKGLQVLQDRDQILQYEILGDAPLVKLEKERQSELRLEKEELERHRNNLLQKLEYINGYIKTDHCREEFIRRYFGERQVQPCGHCDNCLKGTAMDTGNIEEEARMIYQALSEGPKSLRQLAQQTELGSEAIKKSLDFLLREDKVMLRDEIFYIGDENS